MKAFRNAQVADQIRIDGPGGLPANEALLTELDEDMMAWCDDLGNNDDGSWQWNGNAGYSKVGTEEFDMEEGACDYDDLVSAIAASKLADTINAQQR